MNAAARLALVGTLAAASAGFVPPRVSLRPRVRAVTVTVVSTGQMFDLINGTDCLVWPSEDMKRRGGQSGWQGWSPEDGDRGVALARTKHCFQDVMVVFAKLGDNYLAIGESGVRFDEGTLEDLPLLTKP